MTKSGDTFERIDAAGGTARIAVWERVLTGGEGEWEEEVWRTSLPGEIARLYLATSDATALGDKLKVMMASPPKQLSTFDDPSIAWPISLLRNELGFAIGLTAQEPHASSKLPIAFYNQSLRKLIAPSIDWFNLHDLAGKLAKACKILHSHDCIIGDLNPEIVYIENNMRLVISQTDKFQIRDPNGGKCFHTRIGALNYRPRELMRAKHVEIERQPEHDNFALAVMIYEFLTGQHPFAGGRWRGLGEGPHETSQRIQQGLWLYGDHGLYRQTESDLPIDVLHPALKLLFTRCFGEGHIQPSARPSAEEWAEALDEATSALVWCSDGEMHVYNGHCKRCSWCALRDASGHDRWPTYKKGSSQSFELAKQRLRDAHRCGRFRLVLSAIVGNPSFRIEKDLEPIVADVLSLANKSADDPFQRLTPSLPAKAIPEPCRVFVSYARTVSEAMARRLHASLTAAGGAPWLDLLDIPPGRNWPSEIQAAIRACDVFVVLLTPEASASENVQDELHYAFDQKKRIVPVRVAPCDMDFRLLRRQWIDLVEKNYDAALSELLQLLREVN